MNITKGLNEQQLSVFKIDSNKILISSCAGSGKTEVVCRYALFNIKKYKNIIVTTFTNSNIENIKKRFKKLSNQFGINTKGIEIRTIDSLIQIFINNNYPDTEGSDYNKKIRLFDKWLEDNNKYPFNKEYFFIVDEFQDTYSNNKKANILLKLGDLGKGILAVGDVKQTLSNSYDINPIMVFDLFREKLKPIEIVLNKTRRFGKNIALFVNKMTGQEIKYNKNIKSHRPYLLFHGKLTDDTNSMILANNLYNNFILRWIKEGVQLRDIVIIQRKSKNENNYIFSHLENILKRNKKDVVWYQKDKSCKESYNIINDDTKDGKITLCSIMFSKGIEWKKVIFLNCTHWSIPSKKEEFNGLIPSSTLNVAITRGIEELVITINQNFPSILLKPLCNNTGYINEKYVNICGDYDLRKGKKLYFYNDNNKIIPLLTGVVDLAEELSDHEIIELDNLKINKIKIKNTFYIKHNQYYEEYQLKHLYGIIGELLLARELYIKYNNIDELNLYNFIQKYNKKIIIDIPIINNKVDRIELEKINRFLNTYRSDYIFNKNILKKKLFGNIFDFRKLILENKKNIYNKKTFSENNKYFKWGGSDIFNKITKLIFERGISIVLKSDETVCKKFINNIKLSIEEFLNKTIQSKSLSNKCLFYLSCIEDIEKGRIGIIEYNGIVQSHFLKLINNIKKILPLLDYQHIIYQKSSLYKSLNACIKGQLDFYIPSYNNSLELSKIKLQLVKLIYTYNLSEDIAIIISEYLINQFDCKSVIEIKCSSMTDINIEWKLQVLLYMCMNNCNKSRLINIMKGIYWDCKIPNNFNKKLFIENMFKKANEII